MTMHRRFERQRDVYMDVWHRPQNMRNYLGVNRAAKLSMIDVDCVEYCWRCRFPLALIETEKYTPKLKVTAVLEALAAQSALPAYLVSYQTTPESDDIEWFEVTCLTASSRRERLSPQAYAEFLWSLREQHACVLEREA